MNKPTHVIIHCSDSTWGNAHIIDQWHRERGFSMIGYHWVILNPYETYRELKDDRGNPANDGRVEQGRPEEAIGSHCLGYNSHSIGICLVGSNGHFTPAQMTAARKLVMSICRRYGIPIENVLGHCETPQCGGKTCPTLDMKAFRASLG